MYTFGQQPVSPWGRLADRERAGNGSAHLGIADERELAGIIDPAEPAILQQMRRELRLRRKAMKTEKAYVGWVRRFIGHCGSEDLQQFGEPQIRSFLTNQAVEGNVAAGTQDQAKCALLFLYQSVLGRELAFLDVTRANKPQRLPVVFVASRCYGQVRPAPPVSEGLPLRA